MISSIKRKYLGVIAPVTFFVIFVVLAQTLINVLGIEKFVLPKPTVIGASLAQNFFSGMLTHMLITFQEIAIGFVIGFPFGILIAALITEFGALDRAFSPYVILIVTTPLITLVPVLGNWLGMGITVKILACAIQTFPIVVLNASTGFNTVDPLRIELMESLGASRLQTFLKVKFPSALPEIFTGAKLGGIFATIAAISAEFVGGNTGLGARVTYNVSFINTELAFANIILVSAIGFTIYMTLTFIENRIVKW